MKKIITILLVLVVVGCGPKENFFIPKDKKFDVQWLDTFIYKSDLKNFDTLFVSDYLYFFKFMAPPNSFVQDNYEVLVIEYSTKKGKINEDFIKFKEQASKNYSVNVVVINKVYEKMTFIKEYNCKTFGTGLYSDVYEYSSDSVISSLYFNFNQGILGYKTQAGEFFEFYKKIKHK